MFCGYSTIEYYFCKNNKCINYDSSAAICNKCYKRINRISEEIFIGYMANIED